MSLGAMSVAMHLSGLEPQHFTESDHRVRWLYEGGQKLQSPSPTLSTTSTTSSSGFNSWGSDIQQVKEEETLVSSGDKPQNSPSEQQVPASITYKNRDILDLFGNVSDPKWNLQYSTLPSDPQNFFRNRSQYSRVNDDPVPLHVDVACEHCSFITSHFD